MISLYIASAFFGFVLVASRASRSLGESPAAMFEADWASATVGVESTKWLVFWSGPGLRRGPAGGCCRRAGLNVTGACGCVRAGVAWVGGGS